MEGFAYLTCFMILYCRKFTQISCSEFRFTEKNIRRLNICTAKTEKINGFYDVSALTLRNIMRLP